jgi:hypothetical protein
MSAETACGSELRAANSEKLPFLCNFGFVVALLSNRDTHHEWAVTQARDLRPPWSTCVAALSEAYRLLGGRGAPSLGQLLRRRAVVVAFELSQNIEPVAN